MPLLSTVAKNANKISKVANIATAAVVVGASRLSKSKSGSVQEFPIPGYQFSVEMDGSVLAHFQSISDLTVKRNVETVVEGGQNQFIAEFAGPMSYGHITLGGGLTSSDMFFQWMMQGKYTNMVTKKDFFVIQRQPNPDGGTPVFIDAKRWSFHQAFPVSWKLSSLSVDTTTKIAIESLELSFQYFELQG